MANRPIFIPNFNKKPKFKEESIDFTWNPGFSVTQKKKNITSLHENAKKKGYSSILEVSTKSDDELGIKLSAFNLKIETEKYGLISVESAFQGSKVFEGNIQYEDIYNKNSLDAKRDERLRSSGSLIAFKFLDENWKLIPKTSFYDFLYIKALSKDKSVLKELSQYDAFTDIEFNPSKSLNCQARAIAIAVTLYKEHMLDKLLNSSEYFIDYVYINKRPKTLFKMD